MALYCDKCYSDFHSRGSRKMHTFKRIRYLSGTLLPESPAFALKADPTKAQAKQAENTAPNLPKKVVLDQPTA